MRSALWLGGSPDGDPAQVEELLGATSSLVVGTSIVNMWVCWGGIRYGIAPAARSAARLTTFAAVQLLTQPGVDPVPGYAEVARALEL